MDSFTCYRLGIVYGGFLGWGLGDDQTDQFGVTRHSTNDITRWHVAHLFLQIAHYHRAGPIW